MRREPVRGNTQRELPAGHVTSGARISRNRADDSEQDSDLRREAEAKLNTPLFDQPRNIWGADYRENWAD